MLLCTSIRLVILNWSRETLENRIGWLGKKVHKQYIKTTEKEKEKNLFSQFWQ